MFSIQRDGSLVKLQEKIYETEDIFQKLLEDYPELLSGEQINISEPCRWLLIEREMGIASDAVSGSRWSVDHLFLDQNAIPTLIEVKRSTDTRIRREVVGQMMDYAANAVSYWPVERLRERFIQRCDREGLHAETVLRNFLGDDDAAHNFWDDVKTNLRAGKVRLLFVADIIPQELRKIIEFLNVQMDPAEVLGIEIKQFVGSDAKTLIPRVIGQTVEAQEKKSASLPKRNWTQESFFSELQQQQPQLVSKAKRIYEWIGQSSADRVWGNGFNTGAYYATTVSPTKNLFGVLTNGSLQFYFGGLKQAPYDSAESRQSLIEELNLIEGLVIEPSANSAYPSVQLSALSDDAVEQLLSIMQGVIENLQRH